MAPLKAIPENIYQYILDEKEAAIPGHCIICRGHSSFIGYIEKSNPKRMLIYCLCRECFENPDSDSAVEKIIDYYEATRKDCPDLLKFHGEC